MGVEPMPPVEAPMTSSEAHLDLLLAEELAVNRRFLRRFVAPFWDTLTGGSPLGDDVSVVVRLNVWDEGGPACAVRDQGENDIDILVTSGATKLRVLIEDKVWAEFQDEQCGRYQRRARPRGDATVLVAPRSRLHGGHEACGHTTYAIEELAVWLSEQAKEHEGEAMRLRWRAALLRQLCTRVVPEMKPDHPPTVAFVGFCVDWLRKREPRAVPDTKSLRTQGGGWLYFTSPRGLVYKVSHGRVDLYVGRRGFQGTAEDLAAAVASGWGPEGFGAAVDTKGNPVLRYENPDTIWMTGDGVPPDTSGVEKALAAVVVAARWIAEQGETVSLPILPALDEQPR
jgi:hypothetical protein